MGALAGGFGLLPILSAPGCWRAAALLLAALSLAALLAIPNRPRAVLAFTLAGAAAVALALVALPGPTAAWRHSGVGAGRILTMGPGPLSGSNGYRAWLNDSRRFVVWEREGVESSVAVQALGGLAFVVNGKVDGNARNDAPTQVMGGLLGALLRPEVHRAPVVGLGTGSTAGWLADVPGVERTDVVELEPAILDVARMCAPVNRQALDNPRVHVTTGDAREVLMTGRDRYDLVFSEPSNPYRAGIASLFTREFYEAVAARLSSDGVFLQWVQAYEVDERTVATILATLAAVFPEVEVWQVHNVDLVPVASRHPLRHDAAALQARMRQEPFASALRHAWRVTDVDELLAAFVAGPALARHVLAMGEEVNTDDRNPVEFSFARMVAQTTAFDVERMRATAAALGCDRPAVTGAIDWERVARRRVEIYTIANDWARPAPHLRAGPRTGHGARVVRQRAAGRGRGRVPQAAAAAHGPRGDRLVRRGPRRARRSGGRTLHPGLGGGRPRGGGRGDGPARVPSRLARRGGGRARLRVHALPHGSLAEPGRDGARPGSGAGDCGGVSAGGAAPLRGADASLRRSGPRAAGDLRASSSPEPEARGRSARRPAHRWKRTFPGGPTCSGRARNVMSTPAIRAPGRPPATCRSSSLPKGGASPGPRPRLPPPPGPRANIP